MAQSTITKSQLEERVAELEAQLAEAQQQAPTETDGDKAQLNITVLLPESLDSKVGGFPAIKISEYDGITRANVKVTFMGGTAYGRQYSLSFTDHDAFAVQERIKEGKRLTNVACNFRTRTWQKNEFESVKIDSWDVVSMSDVPGVNYPKVADEPQKVESVEAEAPVSDEEIPF